MAGQKRPPGEPTVSAGFPKSSREAVGHEYRRNPFRILESELGRNAQLERIAVDLQVNPRAAVALAMVLNELMTNAAKYGALSQPEGRVQVEWSTTEDGSHAKLRMVWMESGGPLVQSPIRRGFGSTLIEQSITRELGGTLEKNFDPAGLSCTMLLPLERLRTYFPNLKRLPKTTTV